MTVVTWNANSIRARLERFLRWIREHQPDVVALQELKAQDTDFPWQNLADLGYAAAVFGQKTYNGVAIVARSPITGPLRGIPDGIADADARWISGTTNGVRVISAYFPNGQETKSDKYAYKLTWIRRLRDWLCADGLREPTVLCGDFNIVSDALDAAHPDQWEGSVLFNNEVCGLFRELLDAGLVDVFRQKHPEGRLYSWWDYRALSFPKNDGLRLDYILATPDLAARCEDAWVDRDQRKGEKPSDHAPVWANFR